MRIKLQFTALFMILSLSLSCANQDPASGLDNEVAQQVGEAMASIDESGGANGSLAMMGEIDAVEKMFARNNLNSKSWLSFNFTRLFMEQAQAARCAVASTFSACTDNVITRTFGGCTIGTATLSGTVTLTWSDAVVDNTCLMAADGHSVARVPDFILTGPRGGTLEVTKTGVDGQVLTRTAAGEYSFSNDGIRRVISLNDEILYDFTTETTGDLIVTGASRSGRTLTSEGGVGLEVTNNRSGVVCTYIPEDVTWVSTCNCGTSGTWTASCSDERESTITLNGCGSATLTMGGESTDVTFDRCYSI